MTLWRCLWQATDRITRILPKTPKTISPPRITPSKMALEMFTGSTEWVQLEHSEEFPGRKAMAGYVHVRLLNFTPFPGRNSDKISSWKVLQATFAWP